MRRRQLLGTAAGLALGVACGTHLTVPVHLRRIGMLSTGAAVGPDEPIYAAFREEMSAEGFIEGSDYEVIYRFGVSDPNLLQRWARELANAGTDVIVASSTGATQAARFATSVIPIVMVASHDPVEAGVVANLAAPGGNVTGQSLAGGTLMPAQLDLLQQIAPVRRLAYLSPSFPSPGQGYPSVTDIFQRSLLNAASARGIDVTVPPVRDIGDIAAVLAKLADERLDAVFVIESPAWLVPGTRLPMNEVVDFAVRHRLLSISGLRRYAEAGLLVSYGDARSMPDLHRGAARYVAQILHGATPGSLAIDTPKTFELVINAKTASAIGRDIPQHLIDRAAFVIR